MALWFEDLTKTMADDKLPRRQALRRIVGSVAGVALAAWLPGQVLAKDIPWRKQCPGRCNCSDPNGCGCQGNPNTNCFCFPTMKGNPVCICDSFCSQLPTCSSSSQCEKGFVCITNNGCTGCSTSYGVCITKCKGKHKNCQLGNGHGMTVSGRVV